MLKPAPLKIRNDNPIDATLQILNTSHTALTISALKSTPIL